MTSKQKTVIVTGVSQGKGAGVVLAFLARGYNVARSSRSATTFSFRPMNPISYQNLQRYRFEGCAPVLLFACA